MKLVLAEKPSAFVISEDEIDRMLRTGSNFEGGKIRIYAPVSYTHLDVYKRQAQSLTPEQLAVIIQMAQAAVPNPENMKLDEKETEDVE